MGAFTKMDALRFFVIQELRLEKTKKPEKM